MIVVVAGTPQQRAFQDAGYEVNAVHPTTLLDEGFENDWLRALAPNYKRKPPKPSSEARSAKVSANLDIHNLQRDASAETREGVGAVGQ